MIYKQITVILLRWNFNNLDKTTNSILILAFYTLLEKINKNNINLVNKDNLFISKGASGSQMMKIKLDMPLFSNNSTTSHETNADSALYNMFISIIK